MTETRNAMTSTPPRMPVRLWLQRRVITFGILWRRDRWMLDRLPGSTAVTMAAVVVVAVTLAAARPDLGTVGPLSMGAVLLWLLLGSLAQSAGLIVAVVTVPTILALDGGSMVPRVVSASAVLLLTVVIPRVQRAVGANLLDRAAADPTTSLDEQLRVVATASTLTTTAAMVTWGFIVPPMVAGRSELDDLVAAPIPTFGLALLAGALSFGVVRVVQARTGVAPDVPLLLGPGLPGGFRLGGGRPTDPLDPTVRGPLQHLARRLGRPGIVLLGAEPLALVGLADDGRIR